ncbi:MAG: DNA repair protein RecN [Pikeienuella sp.]
MLQSLSIRDIILIERLTLEFSSGLNVLTGETGAGKSILLDSLGFALGRRDAKGLVRAGADQGAVTAVILCPADHPVRQICDDAGVMWEDDGLTLRRIAAVDGPSRAFVNDQRVNAATLRSIGEAIIEVHGQHDDRGLLNPRGHRGLLDAFAGTAPLVADSRATWAEARAAEAALAEAKATAEEAARDREYLAHSAEEMRKLAPEAGEDATLDSERRLMQAAERIRGEVATAAQLISGEGAEGAVADAMRRLGDAAGPAEGRLDSALDALSRAMEALAEATYGVEATLEALNFDPMALERVEERLFALRALARKHHCAPDDLPELADEFERKLNLISAGEGQIADLNAACVAAEAAYANAAAALSAKRVEAAAQLDKSVAAELPSLKMDRARFETSVSEGKPGPEGTDLVTFAIAANPGAPAGPLGEVASGGELSRLLLALKVSLAAAGGGATMIFDEIDRGVGGATADAVGRRLARLADENQVLVVTHSPQVAALGDAHFRIEKAVTGDATRTNVVQLDGSEQRDEIARMLAGDRITDAARAAADALLK